LKNKVARFSGSPCSGQHILYTASYHIHITSKEKIWWRFTQTSCESKRSELPGCTA